MDLVYHICRLSSKGVLVYIRKMNETLTRNEAETADFAAVFAHKLPLRAVVCLWGDLGMGKSVFVRSMIRALCEDPEAEVPSPTYTLVQFYEARETMIWHFDLYRLTDPSEVYETGWEEALSGGIMLVEWSERLGALLPPARIDVRLEAISGNPNHRKITIAHHGL